MSRHTVFEHRIGQHIDDIVASDLPCDMQCQTLARVLIIDQHQDFQHASVVGTPEASSLIRASWK